MNIFAGSLLLAACIGAGVWIKLHGSFRPGNGPAYDPKQVHPDPASPLRGKTIFCLGSSVTAGMAARGVSFVDYMAKIDGCTMIEEAVAASTLADRGPRSYLRRLRRHPATKHPIDCFLCQLSTNDATFRSSIGQISDSFDPADFDVKTTVGGMEAIIAFAEKTWNCPVVFYTGTRYDNPRYHKLVNLLLELQEKWGIEVIDLWHDGEMCRVSETDYKLYMNDGVHPTKAGYLHWWTPAIQKQLYKIFARDGKAAPAQTP